MWNTHMLRWHDEGISDSHVPDVLQYFEYSHECVNSKDVPARFQNADLYGLNDKFQQQITITLWWQISNNLHWGPSWKEYIEGGHDTSTMSFWISYQHQERPWRRSSVSCKTHLLRRDFNQTENRQEPQ